MVRRSHHRRGGFAPSGDELLPLHNVQQHQVQAARDPGKPITSLARNDEWTNNATYSMRPLQRWGREPRLARAVNDALAPDADDKLN